MYNLREVGSTSRQRFPWRLCGPSTAIAWRSLPASGLLWACVKNTKIVELRPDLASPEDALWRVLVCTGAQTIIVFTCFLSYKTIVYFAKRLRKGPRRTSAGFALFWLFFRSCFALHRFSLPLIYFRVRRASICWLCFVKHAIVRFCRTFCKESDNTANFGIFRVLSIFALFLFFVSLWIVRFWKESYNTANYFVAELTSHKLKNTLFSCLT